MTRHATLMGLCGGGLVLCAVLVIGAGMYITVPRGTIHQAYVEYVDGDTIAVTAGYGECNGNYWEVLTRTTYDMNSLASGADFHYIYIDDSESVYPDPVLIDTTTEPSWDESRLGWYAGNDRCIGVVYSPDSSTYMIEFQNNSENEYVYFFSPTVYILNGGSATGSWETLEATAYTPVNATAIRVEAHGGDISPNDFCEIRVAPYENQGAFIRDCGYYAARVNDWVSLQRGWSRDLQWWGYADDDASVFIATKGYRIER